MSFVISKFTSGDFWRIYLRPCRFVPVAFYGGVSSPSILGAFGAVASPQSRASGVGGRSELAREIRFSYRIAISQLAEIRVI